MQRHARFAQLVRRLDGNDPMTHLRHRPSINTNARTDIEYPGRPRRYEIENGRACPRMTSAAIVRSRCPLFGITLGTRQESVRANTHRRRPCQSFCHRALTEFVVPRETRRGDAARLGALADPFSNVVHGPGERAAGRIDPGQARGSLEGLEI
jgi:hypothetical protein